MRGQHIVAVAALIVRDGRVLALRRAPNNLAGPGLWETVSGRLEQGEQPSAGIVREIAEETSLSVMLEERPWDSYAALRRDQPMVVVVYRARYLAGEVRISDEHDQFAWLTADELAARSSLTRLVESVQRALAAPGP
jgi:8-oxo-dGTP diphosphatase